MNIKTKASDFSEAFAVWTGLEPATSCVTGRHSNQLNYQTNSLKKINGYKNQFRFHS